MGAGIEKPDPRNRLRETDKEGGEQKTARNMEVGGNGGSGIHHPQLLKFDEIWLGYYN